MFDEVLRLITKKNCKYFRFLSFYNVCSLLSFFFYVLFHIDMNPFVHNFRFSIRGVWPNRNFCKTPEPPVYRPV